MSSPITESIDTYVYLTRYLQSVFLCRDLTLATQIKRVQILVTKVIMKMLLINM